MQAKVNKAFASTVERFIKYLRENEYRLLLGADHLKYLPLVMDLIEKGEDENEEFILRVYATNQSLKNYARFRKALLNKEGETKKVSLANLDAQPQLVIIHKETGAYLAIPLPAIAYLNDELASKIFTEIPHVDSEFMMDLITKMAQRKPPTRND